MVGAVRPLLELDGAELNEVQSRTDETTDDGDDGGSDTDAVESLCPSRLGRKVGFLAEDVTAIGGVVGIQPVTSGRGATVSIGVVGGGVLVGRSLSRSGDGSAGESDGEGGCASDGGLANTLSKIFKSCLCAASRGRKPMCESHEEILEHLESDYGNVTDVRCCASKD